MGAGHSSDRRRSRNNANSNTTGRYPGQQQQQQQVPPMPEHLRQQFHSAMRHMADHVSPSQQPNGSPHTQCPPQNSQNKASSPGAVQEGETIRILCTVEPSTVVYDPDTAQLTFSVTCQGVETVFYEVHVAVRETVARGEVIYTPNKPKTAPRRFPLQGDKDGVEIKVPLDLANVSEQELAYTTQYPKQKPCVIVLRYMDSERKEHCEHTSVDLARRPVKRRVIGQIVSTKGSCYAVETLFGVEEEKDVAMGQVADGGGVTPPPAVEGALTGAVEDDDDDGTCVVCLTEEKDTAVMPCRHLCLCKECAEQLMKHTPKCPVCRGPIAQLLHMKK